MSNKENILAMDVGNTNIHWSFIKDGVVEKINIRKHDEISLLDWKNIKQKNSLIIISSVFPHITNYIKTLCEENSIQYIELNSNNQRIIKNIYPTLGIDRVCDLISGLEVFKGSPIVVFNYGTATTVSACDKNGNFLGGAIRAGYELELKSLNTNTLLLPHVELAREVKMNSLNSLNNSTDSAILNGVILGQVGFTKEFLERFRIQTKLNPKVLITGGNAYLTAKYFYDYDAFDPELTLKGIYYFYKDLHISVLV